MTGSEGVDQAAPAPIREPVLPRPLPVINEMNQYFWRSGADGRLRILRCGTCGRYFHPYQTACSQCGSRDVKPTPVSGRGTVVSTSVNHQPWFPAIPVPYVLAVVALEEQEDIRLVTNLDLPPDEARHGMAVKVYFERHGEVFIPLFEPA
jgi:uncharacterized OB-fold protein